MMSARTPALRAAIAVVVGGAIGALAACDAADEVAAVARGEALFRSPELSPSAFNVFACATCHGATDAPPTIAVSLRGVTDRAAWWDGNVATLLGAADFCWSTFMRGVPALDPASPAARALSEYLASLSTGAPQPTFDYTIVEAVSEVGRGDATRGADVWRASCAPCHGAPHTGVGRLGPLVAIVPEASREYAASAGVDPRLVVIEKVRHGRSFGVGGNMPFYPIEILSDSRLADLLEYLDP